MVSEGSGQNVFVVHAARSTRRRSNGTLLHGVTRNAILTLARDLELPVREQELPREMLYNADEVFLTGTASEVTPVRSIDRMPIGNGKRGPITTQIQQRFLDLVHGIGRRSVRVAHVRSRRAGGEADGMTLPSSVDD